MRTQQPPALPGLPPPDVTMKRLKRPYSMGDATITSPLARELQPRPPTFQTINGLPQPIQGPIMMSPVEPPRKKRGRPTKSEFERRQAEARERGEVWPKPRNKAKAQRTSAEGTVEASGSIPLSMNVASSEETGGEGVGGNVIAAGSGEESSITSAAPTAVMNPPSTPGSVPPSSPAGQRRVQNLEGLLQPAGQVQSGEKRLVVPGPESIRESRQSPFQPPQSLLPELRPQEPLLRGPPLQQPGPQGQFQGYGAPLPHQFESYQMEERPPSQQRSSQP